MELWTKDTFGIILRDESFVTNIERLINLRTKNRACDETSDQKKTIGHDPRK